MWFLGEWIKVGSRCWHRISSQAIRLGAWVGASSERGNRHDTVLRVSGWGGFRWWSGLRGPGGTMARFGFKGQASGQYSGASCVRHYGLGFSRSRTLRLHGISIHSVTAYHPLLKSEACGNSCKVEIGSAAWNESKYMWLWGNVLSTHFTMWCAFMQNRHKPMPVIPSIIRSHLHLESIPEVLLVHRLLMTWLTWV
jgi:hypothetical protein